MLEILDFRVEIAGRIKNLPCWLGLIRASISQILPFVAENHQITSNKACFYCR